MDNILSKEQTSVTIKNKETVTALLPVQEHRLPLSNLDLLLPALDFGVFFCYKKPRDPTAAAADYIIHGEISSSTTFAGMLWSLKAALAQVLVTYYPLAGEMVDDADGKPEILCNNRGVDFIEAYADEELAELKLYNPDESVEKKLVPKKEDGVLCIQVTELKCGGLVVACTFDHRIADAYSANLFMLAWSQTAIGEPLSLLPTFRRSLLSPCHRPPPPPNPIYDKLYVPLSSISQPKPPACYPDDEAINRIYYIASEDLQWLQSSTHGRTKIEAFTAYLWRAIAAATGVPEDTACHMGIVVDGRSRLGGVDMASYFGNVLSITYGALRVEELQKMGIWEVADQVHGWLLPAVTDEHFRGLIEWVEANGREPAVTRIYSGGGVACVLSSGREFPVAEVEFGWGKAAVGSYHFPWGGSAGYVMPMPTMAGNGDWLVYAHLTRKVTEVLEMAEPPLFRRLTSEHYLT